MNTNRYTNKYSSQNYSYNNSNNFNNENSIKFPNPSPSPSLSPSPYAFNHPMQQIQIAQDSAIVRENHELREDNQILLLRLQKYEKMEPYVNSIIAKNTQLQVQMERIMTQNVYLGKNIKQLHIQIKNLESVYQNRILQLQKDQQVKTDNLHSTYQARLKQLQDHSNTQMKIQQSTYENKIKQLQQHIQQGKQNGSRVRTQNQNLGAKVKLLMAEIQQYKRKMEETLTQKIELQHLLAATRGERDRLIGQMKQLESYNKQIVRNAKNKQDSYMQKIQNKQKTLKTVEKEKQQQLNMIQNLKQQLHKMSISFSQLEQSHAKLSKNHEQMLNDFRALNLKKVELQEYLQESIQRIERREDQLRQLQMFRQEERAKFNNEIARIKSAYQQDRKDYQQAIQHKCIKNQKITNAYNQLLERVDILQKQIWQTDKKLQLKTKQNNEMQKNLELRKIQAQNFEKQLQFLRQKQSKLQTEIKHFQQQNIKLDKLTEAYKKQYEMREVQFQEYVKTLRIKSDLEKQKWSQLFQEQKSKIRLTHQYDKKQIQSYLNKKIMILEGEVEDYRGRLSRAEQEKIQKTQKQIIQTRTLLNLNAKLEASQRRSLQNSKQKDRILYESAAKTVRIPLPMSK